MAKDEDLKILGAIVVTRADEETGERPNDQAEEERHRSILGCGWSQSGFSTPTGQGCPSGDEHGSGLEFTALEPTKSPGGVLERELLDDRVD